MNDISTLTANPVSQGSYASGTELNSLMYYMGGRYWIATALPYVVIGNLVLTTQVKNKNSAISNEVVNRFLDSAHVKDLKRYIAENSENFTIPPITIVSKTRLPFKPVTFGNEVISNEEEMLKLIKDVGSLMGKVTLPLGYTFTCLDGNHRTKAIAEISMENPEIIKGNNMLCNIVHETNNIRIRQDFVDINQNAKVTTASINTLFNSRDPLAKLTAQLIDSIPYLSETTELLAASISKNSKKLYTLNNIKSAIIELAGFNSQSKANVTKLSNKLHENKEATETLALMVDVFFDLLKSNPLIKEFIIKESKRTSIRNTGIISSGTGLIIATRVIHEAMKYEENSSFEDITNIVLNYDWTRANNFFVGKILSSEKTVVNSISSINLTTESLLQILFPQAYVKKVNSKTTN